MSNDATDFSPTRRLIWALARIAMAGLIAAAIIAQLMRTLGIARENNRDIAVTLTNFFSFFTVLSNCLSVILLLIAGIWLVARGRTQRYEPRALSFAFIAIGTYMATTGVVYNVLLRGVELPQGATVPWSNEILHVVGPLFLIAELVLCVARRPLPWTALAVAVVIPIAWGIYTLIRGANVTNPVTGEPYWYPYPFVNPYLVPNGYIGVGLYILAIAGVIMAVAAVAIWRTRTRSVSCEEQAPMPDGHDGQNVAVTLPEQNLA